MRKLYILVFGEEKLTLEVENNMYKTKNWSKYGF